MSIIKKYFKDWNKFELSFLICGLFASIMSSVVFNGTVIDTLYTSLYLITAILLSKGKVECYFIGFVSVFFYGIVSYNQGYYGELIITAFKALPIMVTGIISWLKHQDKEKDTVIINSLSKKEITIALLSQLVLFWAYYFLLKAFNTNNVLVSTFSIVASLIATYLTARRSEHGFIGFIINDIILIFLWGIPVLTGNLAIIPVVLCPVLLLINDIYGAYNWKK